MPESNPWTDLTEHGPGIFVETFLGIYAAAIFCLSWFKLIQFIRAFGIEFSITQTCLEMQIISSSFRIALSVCPNLFNTTYSSATSLTLTGLADAFMFSSVLLMAMYWSDMLNNFSQFRTGSVKFIQSHRRSYIAITIPLILIMWILSVLAGVNIFVLMELLWVIVTLIVSLIYGIYFSIIGYQILKVIKSMGSQTSKTDLYIQMNRVILSVGISNLLYLLTTILILSPSGGYNPGDYLALVFLNFLCSWTISLSVVLSFQTKYATAQPSPSYPTDEIKTNSHKSEKV